jgi:tetratricopeptide (TPR) repeat protein
MLAPRPPLAAYRDDLARRGTREPFGPSDATWISVATILSHGVDLAPTDRQDLRSTLHEVVSSDPAMRSILDMVEEQPSPEFELNGVSPAVRAIVGEMEDAGALNLAYSTLTILADADLRLSVIERGRVLAQLGRVARKAGALDTSREHYRRAEVLGRTARIPELCIRAWIGYSIVARLRGNYPEVRKFATRAAHEAEQRGLTTLASLAHYSLMISSAVAGDLNAALAYGWRAYQGAIGDPAREASTLLNLSQMLLEAGQPAAALRGFAATMERQPVPRLAFPTLGGLAISAAQVGDRTLVAETKARIEGLIESAPFPYECAGTLAELSQALATIGETAGALMCRTRALELAERHRYHEIIHRLDSLRVSPAASRPQAPHMLNPKGREVALAVASLEFAGSAKVPSR